MIIARLGVDNSLQGNRLGKGLLKDALIRAARAADIVGMRALLVHAKDDQARAFYKRYDFEPSATDPYHLLLLMGDIQRFVGGVKFVSNTRNERVINSVRAKAQDLGYPMGRFRT